MSLFAVCVICSVSCAFAKDYIKAFNLSKVCSSDEASLLFWNWLLKYTRLTPKLASLHNIFEDGSAAVFVDLNDDGVREIVGTHYSTDLSGLGRCYLYILKYDEDTSAKYRLISGDLNFDISRSLYVTDEVFEGYHTIVARSQSSGLKKFFVFDEQKKMYVSK